MFGRRLRTRLDLLFPDPRQTRRCQQQRMHESGRAPVKPQKSIVERDVYTKLPHEQLWQPGTVLTSSETEAEIQLESGETVRRHNDFIRPRTPVTPYPGEEKVVPEDLEETNKNQTEEIDQPIAIRKPHRSPKPIERYISQL
ncbi:unnamed protein product [Dicrocoelium dendriticum]|nr:unnamed protein product [Dicrocoelium dendriticum]CAH8644416.1 unnamed protein product [Dicrocoelium dendriticum]